MHPKDLSILDYTYTLPEEKIASYPLPQRDKSKLLIYQQEQVTEDFYFNLHHHLPANSLLVFNNTKVVEARLLFQKSTGSNIEIFCLEPDEQYADITTAMLQNELSLLEMFSRWCKKMERRMVAKNYCMAK
jgi:S-adenosylmethionine:tRNA ribosyltransferase-isomerase